MPPVAFFFSAYPLALLETLVAVFFGTYIPKQLFRFNTIPAGPQPTFQTLPPAPSPVILLLDPPPLASCFPADLDLRNHESSLRILSYFTDAFTSNQEPIPEIQAVLNSAAVLTVYLVCLVAITLLVCGRRPQLRKTGLNAIEQVYQDATGQPYTCSYWERLLNVPVPGMNISLDMSGFRYETNSSDDVDASSTDSQSTPESPVQESPRYAGWLDAARIDAFADYLLKYGFTDLRLQADDITPEHQSKSTTTVDLRFTALSRTNELVTRTIMRFMLPREVPNERSDFLLWDLGEGWIRACEIGSFEMALLPIDEAACAEENMSLMAYLPFHCVDERSPESGKAADDSDTKAVLSSTPTPAEDASQDASQAAKLEPLFAALFNPPVAQDVAVPADRSQVSGWLMDAFPEVIRGRSTARKLLIESSATAPESNMSESFVVVPDESTLPLDAGELDDSVADAVVAAEPQVLDNELEETLSEDSQYPSENAANDVDPTKPLQHHEEPASPPMVGSPVTETTDIEPQPEDNSSDLATEDYQSMTTVTADLEASWCDDLGQPEDHAQVDDAAETEIQIAEARDDEPHAEDIVNELATEVPQSPTIEPTDLEASWCEDLAQPEVHAQDDNAVEPELEETEAQAVESTEMPQEGDAADFVVVSDERDEVDLAPAVEEAPVLAVESEASDDTVVEDVQPEVEVDAEADDVPAAKETAEETQPDATPVEYDESADDVPEIEVLPPVEAEECPATLPEVQDTEVHLTVPAGPEEQEGLPSTVEDVPAQEVIAAMPDVEEEIATPQETTDDAPVDLYDDLPTELTTEDHNLPASTEPISFVEETPAEPATENPVDASSPSSGEVSEMAVSSSDAPEDAAVDGLSELAVEPETLSTPSVADDESVSDEASETEPSSPESPEDTPADVHPGPEVEPEVSSSPSVVELEVTADEQEVPEDAPVDAPSEPEVEPEVESAPSVTEPEAAEEVEALPVEAVVAEAAPMEASVGTLLDAAMNSIISLPPPEDEGVEAEEVSEESPAQPESEIEHEDVPESGDDVKDVDVAEGFVAEEV